MPLWRYQDVLRDQIQNLGGRHQKTDDVEALGLMSAGPDSESHAEADIDVEKSLSRDAGKATNSEET
jgi:hypothetical protein